MLICSDCNVKHVCLTYSLISCLNCIARRAYSFSSGNVAREKDIVCVCPWLNLIKCKYKCKYKCICSACQDKKFSKGVSRDWKIKRAQIRNSDRRRSPNRIGRDVASTLRISTRINEPKIQIQAERLMTLLRMPAIKRL